MCLFEKRFAIFLVVALFFGSCTASRFVEPLDKGDLTAGFNFGGPAIGFGGLTIPIPMLDAEVGYGLDSNLTIYGGLNATSLYFNNIHLSGGATYQFIEQDRFVPNVSVSPSFQFVFGMTENKPSFWPVLDLNAYWNYGKRRNYFYTGINNYFELSPTMAHEQEQAHHWLFSPQIGHVIKGKKGNWQLNTEFKFLGINIDNSTAFIPYKSFTGNYGATGFYIGCRWFINREK